MYLYSIWYIITIIHVPTSQHCHDRHRHRQRQRFRLRYRGASRPVMSAMSGALASGHRQAEPPAMLPCLPPTYTNRTFRRGIPEDVPSPTSQCASWQGRLASRCRDRPNRTSSRLPAFFPAFGAHRRAGARLEKFDGRSTAPDVPTTPPVYGRHGKMYVNNNCTICTRCSKKMQKDR